MLNQKLITRGNDKLIEEEPIQNWFAYKNLIRYRLT
jgi:hypothetical protein